MPEPRVEPRDTATREALWLAYFNGWLDRRDHPYDDPERMFDAYMEEMNDE